MLTIVSHDAGGAEILSSYLRRQSVSATCVLDGPARAIFARKCASMREAGLEAALGDASLVMCGTSWQSDLEWGALRRAHARGLPTVAFLDHWVNYRERFVRDAELCLPREIWVGDDYARDIARETFGDLPIRLVANPYVDDVRAELAAAAAHLAPRAAVGAQVLYVCEPVREHALRQHGDERHWGYVEEDAAGYFLQNIAAVVPGIARIVVRAHPSERADKYAWMAGRTRVPIEFSRGRSLAEDIAATDVVVGCESMAMVVALYGGKRVLTSIPPGGRRCVLPHVEIESISDLLESKQ